jgi:hypothetical protein
MKALILWGFMEDNHVDLAPSPSALIASLRDVGYTMETALADVVDNSITAGAKNINFRFAWDSGTPWFAVIDDGRGMTAEELTEAMRFGCINPLDERHKDDLGRFGLGMKTASFSQCRHLTVLSKKEGNINCCEWNLDSILTAKDRRWLLHVLSDDDINSTEPLRTLVNQYLSERASGTIVLWQTIDRIDSEISATKQQSVLNSLILDAKQHLELVFHRFLSPETGKAKIKMSLNGNDLVALDPFNSKNDTTVELPKETITCKKRKKITVQPYILPHHNKISKEEYQKYAGTEGYLHNQGFYVYRNRRLIIKGTWFRLIKKAELTKLVRVQVDIPNSLDQLWKIDVKKSSASPPESIKQELRRIIGKIECSGKRVYQQKGQRLASAVKTPAWSRRAAGEKVFYEINRNHPLLKNLEGSLSVDQQEQLAGLVRMFEASFPSDLFFSDFAGSPEKLHRPSFEEEHLARLLDDFIDFWGMKDGASEDQVSELLQVDPFSSHKDLTRKLLEQKGVVLCQKM